MLVEQWRANFWNPEWEGAKLPREMQRFLLATFKKASEEFAEGKVAERTAVNWRLAMWRWPSPKAAWMPPPPARRVRTWQCQRQRPRRRLPSTRPQPENVGQYRFIMLLL